MKCVLLVIQMLAQWNHALIVYNQLVTNQIANCLRFGHAYEYYDYESLHA